MFISDPNRKILIKEIVNAASEHTFYCEDKHNINYNEVTRFVNCVHKTI